MPLPELNIKINPSKIFIEVRLNNADLKKHAEGIITILYWKSMAPNTR
jgi:hypothetical protein